MKFTITPEQQPLLPFIEWCQHHKPWSEVMRATLTCVLIGFFVGCEALAAAASPDETTASQGGLLSFAMSGQLAELNVEKGDRVAVLLPLKRQVLWFAQRLREAGLKVETQDDLNFASDTPKVITYHSAKGLTFDSVLLPRLTPKSFQVFSQEQIERLLFVALTRATRWAYLSTDGMLPHLQRLEPMVNEKRITVRTASGVSAPRSVAEAQTDRTQRKYDRKPFTPGFGDPGVSEVFVESSHIISTGYDRAKEILYIKFEGDRVYAYFHVPESVFSDFLAAESHGRFASRYIYWQYEYVRQPDGAGRDRSRWATIRAV